MRPRAWSGTSGTGTGWPPIPGRGARNSTGPRDSSLIAIAINASSGDSTSSSNSAPKKSNMRLITKSRPSNTGGLSSNSGSARPGTNSTRSIRISIVDGATRTRTPLRWQRSTRSTASSSGKSGSAISTSSIVSKWLVQLTQGAEVAQAEVDLRVGRDEPVRLDLGAVAERGHDGLDVGRRAHQHGPAAVAGGVKDEAADALEHPPPRGHVRQREEQRGVEDVVRRELVSLDHRVQQHQQGQLEQRRDHGGEPGPLLAVAVEPRAREQEHHHQARQRRYVECLVQRRRDVCVAELEHELERQRGHHRQRQPGDVDHAEGDDPGPAAKRVELQDARQQQRTARPHVAIGENDGLGRLSRLDLPQLSG